MSSTSRPWKTLGPKTCRQESSMIATWRKRLKLRRCRQDKRPTWWRLISQLPNHASRISKIKRWWATPRSRRSSLRRGARTKKTLSSSTKSRGVVSQMLTRKLSTLRLSERWQWSCITSSRLREIKLRSCSSSSEKKRKSAKTCLTWRSLQNRQWSLQKKMPRRWKHAASPTRKISSASNCVYHSSRARRNAWRLNLRSLPLTIPTLSRRTRNARLTMKNSRRSSWGWSRESMYRHCWRRSIWRRCATSPLRTLTWIWPSNHWSISGRLSRDKKQMSEQDNLSQSRFVLLIDALSNTKFAKKTAGISKISSYKINRRWLVVGRNSLFFCHQT